MKATTKIKINDSDLDIIEGSRVERYWKKNPWENYFLRLRPRLKLPKALQTNDLAFIKRKFNLRGIGFGNWVTVEDRINYTRALVTALYDLNKILNFKKNVGMTKKLSFLII